MSTTAAAGGTPSSAAVASSPCRSAETIAESCVRQPSYLAHLSTVLEEVDIEQWRPWLLFHVLRSAAPYLPDGAYG